MNILYGTGNPAKLKYMRRMLAALPIAILGLGDMPAPPPDVPEGGASPLENARIKALAYYSFYHMPVFSCDSGLFFADLPASEQPGVHVRLINGRRLDDNEVIAHYAALAGAHGGALIARYRNAICLVMDDDRHFESMADALSGKPFKLVATPHPHRRAGFPLDSLSVDIATGRYYDDFPSGSRLEEDGRMQRGFQRFFADALGLDAADGPPSGI